MDLKLDSKEIKAVISEAILRALDEKKRDELIKAALESLLERRRDGGYDRKSHLEEAFEWAARQIAMEKAREFLLNDVRFTEGLQQLLGEAVTRVMESHKEDTVTRIAESIITGLTPKGRY